MPNSTIINVPTKFDEIKQVRAFAVKLVEKLDVALGYRGANSLTAAELSDVTFTTVVRALQQLQVIADNSQTTANETSNAVLELTGSVNANAAAITVLKSADTVADTAYTAPTISATYSQSEVQAIADNLETVSTQLDALLAALRATEIIAT